MENKELTEKNEVKEKLEDSFSISCSVRIEPSSSTKEIKRKPIKFNTIISDPDDEHPDSHLWE
jgi:hypothetical protein